MRAFLAAGLALATLSAFGMAVAQPRVVVTLHPYFDLVQRIAGPDASVVRLLPPGASPHGFDPTPSLAAQVEGADLIVLNGGLDEWALELVPQGADAPEVFEVLSLFEGLEGLAAKPSFGRSDVDPAPDDARHAEHEEHDQHGEDHAEHEGSAGVGDHAEEHHDEHEHADETEHDEEHAEHREGQQQDEHGEHDADHAHDHGGVNAHIWLDPLLMADAVGPIAERLAEIDPAGADMYRRNAEELEASLRALHAELEETLAPVHGRPFVPFHDAWPYFVGRYGLDLVIEIEPFPGREPGPRYLAEVVGAIRDTGANVVFAEAQFGARPAEVIAQEAGVAVATLDPIGGVAGLERYEEILRSNAQTIVDALEAP